MGFFGNLKDKMKAKAVEKMLEKQMGQLPPEQKEAVMSVIEKNPEFFESIAKEIEQEIKKGKPQIAAAMSVMRKHQAELQKKMMEAMGGNPIMKDRNLR